MKTVTLYTDGACSGNPGPGGWGAILEYKGTEKELSGGEANTTNNRMELTAVIKGLQALKEPCIVELYSDSKYVIDALEKGWAWGWKKKNWIKSDKRKALNPDLWDVLLALTQKHEVHYHWVKGHATNPKNIPTYPKKAVMVMLSANISLVMFQGLAPMALRTPNSRVRSLTVISIMLLTPTIPLSRVRSPIIHNAVLIMSVPLAI